jgi:hypothetical protein
VIGKPGIIQALRNNPSASLREILSISRFVGRYGQLTQLLGNGQVGSNAVNLEHKASKVFRPKAADFAEVPTKPTVRVIFSLLPDP